MDCIAPEDVSEGDLLAYVEGQAERRVRDHVARCSSCASEAVALSMMDRALSAAIHRASCPATDELLQYQARLLQAGDRRRVARHVRTCLQCTKELAQFSTLDEPQHSLWEEMRRASRTVVEALFVPPPQLMAAAVRGGQFSPQLYRANGLDLVLGSEMWQPPNDLWRLRGRVTRGGITAADVSGRTVRSLQEDRIVASGLVDDLGYFSLAPFTAGQYDVWLDGPEADVVVRGFVVGRPERMDGEE
jgi:anti-sigma factor RsiW